MIFTVCGLASGADYAVSRAGGATSSTAVVGLSLPSNRGGFSYAAAGWSTAIFSYSVGDINAAELCRRRVL